MGTSTTERGAVGIPGEPETDWIFTVGLTSITPVCWSEPSCPLLSRVSQKKEETHKKSFLEAVDALKKRNLMTVGLSSKNVGVR